ncbi:MAG: hypothetical protein AAGF26_19365 [Cyanobacteria bacterium P01_G01_bin.49]
MRNNITFCTSLIASSLIMSVPMVAQDFSRNSSFNNNCDYGNYLVTNHGQCVDLSEDDSNRYNFYEGKFLTALHKVGVSISYESCEAGLLGYYQPDLDRLTICQNNRRDFNLYIETLAHESWHVVQDCAAGFRNGEIMPIMKTDPSTFRSILVSLRSSDWESLNLYNPQDLPYEGEAFLMEKHPDQVLQALNICANRGE